MGGAQNTTTKVVGEPKKIGGSSNIRQRSTLQYGYKHWVKLATSGVAPSPRSGHDVLVIGSKAYLFGGCGGEDTQIACLNDVFVFDLELHQWEKVVVKGDVPLPRASFGMCAGPTPNTIIVAGGTGVGMDSLRADIVEFDSRSRTWSEVLIDSEETPCKFYGQSVCTYGDTILLFGGSTGLHYANDLYEYNTRYNIWKKLVTSGRCPTPRYKHQAVVVGDIMYIIGGGCFKPEQTVIDVYMLNLKTLTWEIPEMGGDIPLARVAHSCSYDIEEDTIYMWGGFTGELSRLQDFYAFHCGTGVWRREGAVPPPPRKLNEMAGANGQPVRLTAASARFAVHQPLSAAQQQQRAASRIVAQAIPLMQQPQPQAHVVVGPGVGASSAAAPVSTVASAAEELCLPPARAFHSAIFYNGSLYVFSGANGDIRYSDVWRYRVRGSPPCLSMLAAHAIRSNANCPELCEQVPHELMDDINHMNEHADRFFFYNVGECEGDCGATTTSDPHTYARTASL